MKTKIASVVVLPFLVSAFYTQHKVQFAPEPYFSAVIVSNIDSSALWYKSVFDLKTKNEINEPANGFRVIILESPKFLVELIQNKSWPNQHELLKNKPAGSHIQGFFKIGFKVTDMQDCINHLKNLNIAVDRVYTDSLNKKNFLIADPDGNLIQFYD